MSHSPNLIALIDLAIAEDLSGGDVTTDALFDGSERSDAELIAKESLVFAGGPVFSYVFERIGGLPGSAGPASVTLEVDEGEAVEKGRRLVTMEGPTATLLKAERLGLNLLQRMCGVATQTRAFAAALGDKVKITDTRKTTPGLRELERYAVRVGGGRNHRYNLGGGVLIKENHVRAAGGIEAAIKGTRRVAPHSLRIEVEVTNLDEVNQALAAGADIIMLDNMDIPTMEEAIRRIDHRAIIEVSGNVTLERLPALGKLDVDFVSSGALTHSVKASDISMLFKV